MVLVKAVRPYAGLPAVGSFRCDGCGVVILQEMSERRQKSPQRDRSRRFRRSSSEPGPSQRQSSDRVPWSLESWLAAPAKPEPARSWQAAGELDWPLLFI